MPSPAPEARPSLTRADYLGADERLSLTAHAAADYADAAPGTLFSHPAWLRAYGAGDLVVVAGRPERGAPRLVFTRERGGLVHQGRLARMDDDLVAAVGDRLMAEAGAAFVVFEDIEIAAPPAPARRRSVFHYQNNWRLPLPERDTRIPKRIAANTKRTLRNLARDNPDVAVRFAAGPGRDLLDTITAFGRIRIEGQGRRYGIDALETTRLAAVASEIGHSSIVTMGDTVLAADVICVAGDQAYFLTHGYHPGYPTSSLGKITLLNSIEACAALGLRDFNLMWGDLPYKEQIGATCIPLRTIVTRRAWLGLLHPGYLATLARFAKLDLKRRLKPTVARLRAQMAERRSPAR